MAIDHYFEFTLQFFQGEKFLGQGKVRDDSLPQIGATIEGYFPGENDKDQKVVYLCKGGKVVSEEKMYYYHHEKRIMTPDNHVPFYRVQVGSVDSGRVLGDDKD